MHRQGLPTLLGGRSDSESLPLRKPGQPKRLRQRALTPKTAHSEAKSQAGGKDAGQNSPSRKVSNPSGARSSSKQSNAASVTNSFYRQISRRLAPFLELPSRLLGQRSNLVHDSDYEELMEAFKAGRARAVKAMCEGISQGLLDVAFAGWVCFHKSLQSTPFSDTLEDPALLRRLFLSWACMHRVQKSERKRRVSTSQNVRRVSTSRQSVLGMISRHEHQVLQQIFEAWARKEEQGEADASMAATFEVRSTDLADTCLPEHLPLEPESLPSETPSRRATLPCFPTFQLRCIILVCVALISSSSTQIWKKLCLAGTSRGLAGSPKMPNLAK